MIIHSSKSSRKIVGTATLNRRLFLRWFREIQLKFTDTADSGVIPLTGGSRGSYTLPENFQGYVISFSNLLIQSCERIGCFRNNYGYVNL